MFIELRLKAQFCSGKISGSRSRSASGYRGKRFVGAALSLARTVQKSVSGYERRMKRLCRRWGLPTDDTPWAYDTMEKSIRERMLHE